MKKSWGFIFCLWLVVSCASYQTIEDRHMESILAQALLTNAIATSEAGYAAPGTSADTVDYYTPILARYGYTLNDFRGTITEMATRKSNPLAEIFTRVNRDLDSLAVVAQYRYNIAKRCDSIALAHYADTLYRKDTTLRGSVAKLSIPISQPRAGTYRLAFAYRSTADYRLGSKSVEFRTKPTGPVDQKKWIDRSIKDTTQFLGEFELLRPRDTLIVRFVEPKRPKINKDDPPLRDTSFVQNIRLVYTPPLAQARRDYSLLIYQGTQFFICIKPDEENRLPLFLRR